jgi:glucose-6-phosphate dehydrogenase assembly protein OpcA
MASPLEKAPAEQAPLLSWQGSDVSLKSVVDELQRLEGELARAEAKESDQQPRPRTSAMNMIVVASDPSESARAVQVLDGLAVHHPSRGLVVELGDDSGENRLDAEVLVGAREVSPGFLFPFERILLKVSGQAANHIVNLIEPFLQPDLSTHLWWMGNPPLSKPRLLETVPMCSTLLVDSAAFERPFDTFIAFSELVERTPPEIGIEDLHWARLHPWRELLAQFFSAPDTLPLLAAIRGIGIDYAGEGRGNRVLVALLVGWLASSLRWELQRAIGSADGRVLISLRAPDGADVEIGCQPRHQKGLEEGEIVGIRLHAESDDGSGSVTAERDPSNPQNVRVRMDVGGKRLQHVLAVESQHESELLVRALMMGGRDRVYMRSLQVAGGLLRSFSPR